MILHHIVKLHRPASQTRTNHVNAKNHVALGHCASIPFFLPGSCFVRACRALISGNAKSIPMLARVAKARRSRAGGRLLSIKSECIRVPVYRTVCREKWGGRSGRGRGYRPHKVLDDTLLLVVVWTPPNGLHMSYARYKMANIL